jgi:hypothetical protein
VIVAFPGAVTHRAKIDQVSAVLGGELRAIGRGATLCEVKQAAKCPLIECDRLHGGLLVDRIVSGPPAWSGIALLEC